MSKLVTKEHSYVDILKGSMAQTQNKNQKNPTHCTCCKFGCCGIIFCEWSFSIFIFLELLAFKLLDGG
jgi:hypothetical protein